MMRKRDKLIAAAYSRLRAAGVDEEDALEESPLEVYSPRTRRNRDWRIRQASAAIRRALEGATLT
jgi:hypothetical protein